MATYSELAGLRQNAAFRSRVEIAVAKYAQYIMDEAPNTPNHKIRFQWASNALLNPGTVAEGLIPSIILDGTVGAGVADQTTIADAAIQAAAEEAVNRLLNT